MGRFAGGGEWPLKIEIAVITTAQAKPIKAPRKIHEAPRDVSPTGWAGGCGFATPSSQPPTRAGAKHFSR